MNPNRNIFTERRRSYNRFGSEPKWVPWVGWFVAGCLTAYLLYLGV